MIPILRKELIIYALLLLVFTFLVHPDMLSNPASRFDIMKSRANFAHPLLYTGVLYFIILVIRMVGKWVMRFLKQKY